MELNVLRQLSSATVGQVLIASIWQGLVLTAVAGVCLKCMPSLRAATRHRLWLIVFLVVAFLPGFSLIGVQSEHIGAGSNAHSLELGHGWAVGLLLAWGAASLLSLLRLAVGAWQIRSMRLQSEVVDCGSIDGSIQALLARRGARAVELRLSDVADAPSVIGFLRPAVVLPRSLWGELSVEELRQVILHEMAHLRRGDDWTNLLQKLLRGLLPLNPALFWAEQQLCREREKACDDAVVEGAGNARSYAACLTRLAESRLVRRAAALAPGLWKRRSELAARVDHLISRRGFSSPAFSRVLAATCLMVTFGGVVALEHAPRLVTFGGGETLAAPAVATQVAFHKADREVADLATYHEAVFHPTPAPKSATPDDEPAPAKPRAPNRPRAKAVAMRQAVMPQRYQFVQLRSVVDETGPHLSLMLFTVEVPQASKQVSKQKTGSPEVRLPSSLSSADSWIFFQI